MLYSEASLLSIDILICFQKKKKKREVKSYFFPPKKYKFVNMNILPNISKKNLKTFGGDIDPPKPSNIKRKRAT